MTTEFADISSHQKGADLVAYARADHDRVLLKATEGTGYVNPHFAREFNTGASGYADWWRWAGTLGLVRGAYHFARPSRAGGKAEAEHFSRTLRAAGGVGPHDWVCLDAEDVRSDRTPVPGAAAHAAEFCARMVELGYPRGVVYSYTPYLTGCGLAPDALPPGWRNLHVANYGRAADTAVPLPPGWGRQHVVARQYTDAARIPGMPGGVDANRIVREWLDIGSPREDDVTEQDKIDIVNRVLEALRRQVFDVSPPIKQAGVGQVVGATYNKVGDVQAAIGGETGLNARVGLVGAAIDSARREIAAVGEKVDALAATVGTEVATTELEAFADTGLQWRLDALLAYFDIPMPETNPEGELS